MSCAYQLCPFNDGCKIYKHFNNEIKRTIFKKANNGEIYHQCTSLIIYNKDNNLEINCSYISLLDKIEKLSEETSDFIIKKLNLLSKK